MFRSTIVIAAAMAVNFLASSGAAQDPAVWPSTTRILSSPLGITTASDQISPFSTVRSLQPRSKLNSAIKNLRNAETSQGEQDALKEIENLLVAEFTNSSDAHQNHITKLEKQLDSMKAKLQKRVEAKDEIVALRLKVIRAEADDLGWSSQGSAESSPFLVVPKSFSTESLGASAYPDYSHTHNESDQRAHGIATDPAK